MTDNEKLIALAAEARQNAYAPYSGFKVGAALLTESGRIFTGCNIENASYGETVCAERTAIFKAVSEGERSFTKITIVGGKDGEEPSAPCFPCGACRQVMAEFSGGELKILFANNKEYSLKDLLPQSFKI